MAKIIKYLFFITILAFFSACSVTQDDIRGALQSNSAELITKDKKKLQELLVKFKTKLDKRNPNNFSKKNRQKIYISIEDFNKKLYLKYKKKVLKDYKDYLQMAFSKDSLFNRNDYLILGMTYMISNAYSIENFHALTAFQFNKEKLHNLYKNLQVIRWRIKVEKDLKDDYLFLTWQNNWQIQLEKLLQKRPDISYEEIKDLEYIKNKKETLFSHSNFSFEVLLTQMIDRVENSLKALGEEPRDLSISALTFFVFL
jgi:hypothetical protein